MTAAQSPERRRLMAEFLRRIDRITLGRPGGFPAAAPVEPVEPPAPAPPITQAEPGSGATPPRAAPAQAPSRRRLWLIALAAAATAGFWLFR